MVRALSSGQSRKKNPYRSPGDPGWPPPRRERFLPGREHLRVGDATGQPGAARRAQQFECAHLRKVLAASHVLRADLADLERPHVCLGDITDIGERPQATSADDPGQATGEMLAEQPRRASSVAIARPRYPVPPVTSTLMRTPKCNCSTPRAVQGIRNRKAKHLRFSFFDPGNSSALLRSP